MNVLSNDKIRFEYDITAHCNLNCAGCSHYSPVAVREFVTAKQADRELSRLGEIIAERCDIIHLMGGEPLLNPELCEILVIARRAFPHTALQIVTNGLLLGSMPAAFWKTCHDQAVSIFLTTYPLRLPLSKIEAYANVFHVNIRVFRNGDIFSRYPLSKAGAEDPVCAFSACPMKHCQQLHDGKLYMCSLTGCVYRLNRAFEEHFEIQERDYLDIYENITADDIFSFLNSPVPFCRYCKVKEWEKHEHQYRWQPSSRCREEWIIPDEVTE